MKRLILIALIAMLAGPALAQQQPDPAFLQKAIAAMQAQRNQAMDADAVTEAKLALVTDELAKANAHIKELEAPKEEPKK